MIRKLWIEVRSSLWFVPAVLVLIAMIVATSLVEIDQSFATTLNNDEWRPLLGAGAEGARGMLTAIAGAMITVVGVAFSVTIVTLSLASTQYTPRILRNFMRDRANQFVLGIFVAIYTYCLIVLRTIRGGSEFDGSFVPLVAVAFGMLLALLSIGCLIFFIHHVATSIQASSILKSITAETHSAIESLFPDEIGANEAPAPDGEAMREGGWHPVTAHGNGYLQHVSADRLIAFTEKHETLVRLERIPGDFVTAGAAIASTDRALEKDAQDGLLSLLVVGEFRTVEQDASFGIRQIVDIAMKALSPGVNDTSTAVSCLDYLGAILAELVGRRLASDFRGEDGKLRVIASARDFTELLALVFDEIRLSAAANVTILLHMLEIVRRVAGLTTDNRRRDALLRHAGHVAELADHSVAAPYDRARLNAKLDLAREALRVAISDLPALQVARTAEVWT